MLFDVGCMNGDREKKSAQKCPTFYLQEHIIKWPDFRFRSRRVLIMKFRVIKIPQRAVTIRRPVAYAPFLNTRTLFELMD
jgi:hypothetical protein